jgi:hypothetical protein
VFPVSLVEPSYSASHSVNYVPLDGFEPDAKVETLSSERVLHVCLEADQGRFTQKLYRNTIFMNIKPSHFEALKALGYTEAEARFLYIVATHSGCFVARQFLAFTEAHWGKRTTLYWNKLQTKRHARTECFPKSGTVYHLFSRRLYRQIDRENIRNCREHETEFIQRRIAMPDFVLLNHGHQYLETEAEKVSFFGDKLKVLSHFLPSKIYRGQRTSQPTVRYFVNKFPMFLTADGSSPVATFTFLHGPEENLTAFVHHLEAYLPLFRQPSAFRFLYLARVDSHFEKAKELFDSLVTIPLGADVSADLLRYFQIRKTWDLSRYAPLTEADLIFRNQAKTRFAGPRFEHLYRSWKVGRVTDSDIRQDFGGSKRPATVDFATEVLCRFAVPEQEPELKGAEGKDYTLHPRLHLFLHPVAHAISSGRVGCRTQCKQASPWKKHQSGRERPHFFGLQPPKKFVGSLPPAGTAIRAACFSAVTGSSEETEFCMHTPVRRACLRGRSGGNSQSPLHCGPLIILSGSPKKCTGTKIFSYFFPFGCSLDK